MSRTTNRTGVRVNRRAHYVHVESATVRDTRLSFRALGLLTYLLDQSEDWQVRSEQLSTGEGREGRDAIRKALHELARYGYYRLERRRFKNGQRAMGTAISEFAVEQWAQDYETFGQKLDIPVLEQEDGTYLVQYPDGSLGNDGFEPAAGHGAQEEPPAAAEPQDEKPQTAPEPPAEPAPAPRQRKSAEDKATDKDAKPTAADQKAAEKALLDADAEEVASWWWAHAETHLGKYVGDKRGYIAMRNQVRAALAKGYTKKECGRALQEAHVHWPSSQQWQRALGVVTNHIAPGRQANGRVPYSDQATWGGQDDTPTTTDADTGHDDQDDDVSFGVVARA
ncbi:hypothetical protein ABZ468_07815 [Streptomyces sp. NPDC005708]|uniref:hypothetical protein n=1 Tax=Streptomyces sp. NPDC005708 TaxID=3154564 RepID=UPI0033F9A831